MAHPARTLDGPRYFLIVSSTPERRQQIADAIQVHVERTHVTFGVDGSDAISKFQNFPPHVLVIDEELPKQSGIKVIEWALKCSKERTAFILLAAAPEDEKFVDEVVLGQVQFVTDVSNENIFSKVLSRALNFLSSGSPKEFTLRFLSPGDILLRRGDKAENVYILRAGQLCASLDSGGERLILGLVEVGEFVGEMAYIDGEPRSADVQATRDCELIEIPIDMMDHLLFLKPAWSKALMKTLSRRIKDNNAALKNQ